MATRDLEGSLRPIQSAMLGKLCQALRRAGHGRALVQLVEAWSAYGRLPPSVALLEARVLLEMRLVDRSWVRLQECESELGETLEHTLLYTELYLQRGWPARARRHVEKALEIHADQPDLLALLRSSSDPPPEVPSDARERERTGTPEERLDLAERYLCTGSHLKARSVLERLRATEGYWSERVEDLIWGIEGQFAQDDEDVMALAESLLPLVASLDGGHGGGDVSTQTRVGPVLVDMDDLPVALTEAAAFPSLFRWLEDESVEGESGAEVTAVSHMEELLGGALEELSEDEEQTGTNQTRIMHVIHRDQSEFGDTTPGSVVLETAELSDVEPTADPDHSVSSDELLMDGKSDLGGVEFESDALLLEPEDADRVVVTRMEGEPTDVGIADDIQPIEVVPQELERMPTPVAEKKQVVQTSPLERASGWREEKTQEMLAPKFSKAPSVATKALTDPVVTSDEPDGVIGRNLLVVALVVILVGGLGLLVGNRILAVRSARLITDEAYFVLNQANYQELLRSEARLELKLSEGRGPMGSRYAAMALVELALWGEFSGGPRRLEVATQSIQAGARFLDSTEALVLAEAWKFFYLGDLSSAQLAIASSSLTMTEVVFLQSRIAYEEERFADSRELVERLLSRAPESIRNQLWLAKVCTDSSDLDCARAALGAARSIDSDHPELELIQIRVDSQKLKPHEQIKRLSIYLREHPNLAPRRAGSVEYEMAALYEQLEDQSNAKAALARVLARDPENPSARYLSGAIRYEENRLKLAFSDFEACLKSKPSDLGCAAGRIYVLLDQDRVELARAHVDEFNRTDRNSKTVSLLDAWVSWSEERDGEYIEELVSGLVSDPEAAMLFGLVSARAGNKKAAESEFLRAVEGMRESSSRFQKRLVGRAYANLALLGSEERYDDFADMAIDYGRTDPIVRVLAGKRLESADFPNLAAAQLELAKTMAPENALVYYASGAFYLDSREQNHQKTRDDWHRYRQLLPSGPRAKRVESRLQVLQ